jgi:hypothetical protein
VSSNAYSAEFQPDPFLRRIVFWSGIALAVAGVLVIAVLPLLVGLRVAGIAVWAAWSLWDLVWLKRSWEACRGLRLAEDGAVDVLDDAGEWRRARLESGGILLRHQGWIRIRPAGGRAFAEPLRGACRKSRDWRRLQVIWRHIGAAE